MQVLSHQARRQLKALLVDADPTIRAQGRALLDALTWAERLDIVRWIFNPRRRRGRHVLSDIGSPLKELPGVQLLGADLSSASMAGADLRNADLRKAVLDCADLRGADLRGADLSHASVTCADFSGADLRGARLMGIDVRDCWSDLLTKWPV